MNLYQSNTYIDDLRCAIAHSVNIQRVFNSSILITGASGLIGSFLVDMLLLCNKENGSNITIYALGRNQRRLENRFLSAKTDKLVFIEHDVCNTPKFDFKVDFILHAASNAYPSAFNNYPVDTIMSNILGTKHLLDYGLSHSAKRLLYVSSGEVYGQGDLSLDSFDESYSGYVNPISPRSCYPTAKRAAETLCISFTKQYGLDTVIVRPSHTYGPTATASDNRANVQFVNMALTGENIVLNSAGNQMRSYTYIADTASAILTVLTCGKRCEAYNIANKYSVTTIVGFAHEVAKLTGVNVVFDSTDEVANAERSPITKQILDSKKVEELGWRGFYLLVMGISNLIKIFKNQ